MAPLTYRQRKELPTSAFALPEERKYPIDTHARAINAEGKAERFATPKQKKQIFRSIHKKYPDLPKGVQHMESLK